MRRKGTKQVMFVCPSCGTRISLFNRGLEKRSIRSCKCKRLNQHIHG